MTGPLGEPRDYDDPAPLGPVDQLRNRLLDIQALENLPDPEWLIDRFLLRNSCALLYGRRGSYKSFLALSWALSIASGRRWFDRETICGPVLYLAAEGASGLHKRVRAWETEFGALGGVPITFLPLAVNLIDAKWSDAIAELCEEQSAEFVVLDTVARNMPGGDENSSRDMGLYVAGVDRIRERTGACVLSIHHPPRAGGNPRGSTALEGAMDTVVETTADGKTMVVRMGDPVGKQKDAAPAPDLMLTLKVLGDTLGDSCVLVEHDGTESGLLSPQMLEMLTVLDETDVGIGVSSTLWHCQTTVAARTFYRHRKQLLKLAFTANVGSEKRPSYSVTDLGKQQIHCHAANPLPTTAMAAATVTANRPPSLRGGGSGSNGTDGSRIVTLTRAPE
jgi:AAA domain